MEEQYKLVKDSVYGYIQVSLSSKWRKSTYCYQCNVSIWFKAWQYLVGIKQQSIDNFGGDSFPKTPLHYLHFASYDGKIPQL